MVDPIGFMYYTKTCTKASVIWLSGNWRFSMFSLQGSISTRP